MKRAWLIATYPFRLIYMVVGLPFKIAYIILKDSIDKPRKKITRKNAKDIDFLGIGKLFYSEFDSDFEAYYNSFLTDSKAFYKKFNTIVKSNGNPNLMPVDVLRLFGDYKQKTAFIDWRGEENEYALEEMIETLINQKVGWAETALARASVAEEKQRDGKFILKLFTAVDIDLKAVNKRLLFFETDFDAYVFMPVETATFNNIMSNAAGYFQAVENL